jgi:Domain of unknown function (DUF4145)
VNDIIFRKVKGRDSKVGMFMQQHYVPPAYGSNSFNCPNCFAFSQQNWYEVRFDDRKGDYFLEDGLTPSPIPDLGINGFQINNLLAISVCYQCDEVALWIKGEMVYPRSSMAPLPNPDMPEDVKKIYNEAREVSSLSPRASAALLRLALEMLLPQVGAKKDKIDNMIGELVGKGLPKEVEKALDSLRVIGNEAVHPGTIDIDDNADVAFALFKLLNFVVDRLITQQKEIDEIYSLIPEEKLKGINRRNNRVLQNK